MQTKSRNRLRRLTRSISHYEQMVAPTTDSVKGLRERQLLRSAEDPDEGISVSIWDSLEDLLEYERGPVRQRLAKEIEYLYRGEYWVKHFEVIT